MAKSNTAEFIMKANVVHKNKYNYSKAIYVGSKYKITITCDTHGEFEQVASHHLRGGCCPKCAYNSLSTTKEFINRANKIHNDEFDYSKTIYTGSKYKVIITCQEHGDFLQTPNNHLAGNKCRKCSVLKSTLNTKLFTSRANKVHNDFYNYSKAEYFGCAKKVIITCLKHGDFLQTPNSHLSGNGCRACSKIKSRSNTNEFIIKSEAVHGNSYDYSKVDYIKNSIKVIIICNIHGEFLQAPNEHLKGRGCRLCGIEKTKLGTKNFIEKSNIIHSNVYDYSKVIYEKTDSSVIITCKDHGDFSQKPHHHLLGSGCQRCASSKGESRIHKILTNLDIKFSCQKTFPGCEYKSKLRFDFYLPDHNLCIEYDGIQHYEGWWKNPKKSLASTKRRDEVKNKFCEDKGIKLLRIPYFDFDRINEILIEKLGENHDAQFSCQQIPDRKSG